ncbi:MAG: ABC transporter substrate-binding protein [Methyloprofundus sp.]|nr:ABC transporter substrate-binding protein [Methyloprofundus sp.]
MLSKQRFTKLGFILSVTLLTACSAPAPMQTGVGLGQNVQSHSYEKRAQNLFLQGKYHQSAALFQRLADTPSSRQNIFRLEAAQALMQAQESVKAKRYLDLVDNTALNTKQNNRLHQLYVQYAINLGNAEQAMQHLQLISFAALSPEQQQAYYANKAFAYALTGDMLASVQQRIELDAYLEAERKQENNIVILENLRLVSIETLTAEIAKQPSAIYAGWLELAVITDPSAGMKNSRHFMQEWSLRYPQHPGQELIQSGYFIPAGIAIGNVNSIAVLLPESGPYAAYAAAIKTGILAAQRGQESGEAVDIQFYDTQLGAVAALYQQAVLEGAQLVIGPLNKKRVVELAETTELTVPVLALNYSEGLLKNNLFQFALSPIDEVQQAVKQAFNEGHKNALILAPATAEGERIKAYFQNAWEDTGGTVIGMQSFQHGERDFSVPVQQMLNIDESRQRYQKVSRAVGHVEYNARRRSDVDVIFMVAKNSVARLINPQFYHNRARTVAVYGLSRVYAGQDWPKKDIDLEGVNFCTIPWLFTEAYQGELNKQALEDTWQALPAKQWSLVAFGLDAYNLLPYLNDLAEIPYAGATGELLLNEYNRVERGLVCAKFKRGKAELLVTEQAQEQELQE